MFATRTKSLKFLISNPHYPVYLQSNCYDENDQYLGDHSYIMEKVCKAKYDDRFTYEISLEMTNPYDTKKKEYIN